MTKAMKTGLIAVLSALWAMVQFIYKVGFLIESIFVVAFRYTVLPVFRFLKTCTPKNVFEWICRLGERVMAITVAVAKGIHGGAVWFSKSFVHDFSYWAPIFCVVMVIWVAIFFRNNTIALEVTVGDKAVSYVNNEREFTQAVAQVEKNLASTLGENYCMYSVPKYKFVVVRKNRMADEESLYVQAYRAVTEEIGNHFGLYVDGELVAASEQKETIEMVLEELKAPYETGVENERVEFVKSVEIRSGLFSPSDMKDAAQLRQLFAGSTDPRYYTIQEDDYLSDIVEKTGVSRKMIYFLNPELDERRLIPGRKLLISEPDVYLGVKVVRTISYEESIAYTTKRIASKDLYLNQTKVKKAGQKGVRAVTAEVTYIDGQKTGTKILSSKVTREPVTRELYVGTKNYPTSYSSLAGTGAFIHPLGGRGYISSRYGGSRSHKGIDLTMSGAYGKPIYASASGTVIYSGYYGTYGYLIKIRHSNGFVSLYSHNSANLVSVGQYVNQGQQIARIGSTGRSTGPHLHFEIQINGSRVNPYPYIY